MFRSRMNTVFRASDCCSCGFYRTLHHSCRTQQKLKSLITIKINCATVSWQASLLVKAHTKRKTQTPVSLTTTKFCPPALSITIELFDPTSNKYRVFLCTGLRVPPLLPDRTPLLPHAHGGAHHAHTRARGAVPRIQHRRLLRPLLRDGSHPRTQLLEQKQPRGCKAKQAE